MRGTVNIGIWNKAESRKIPALLYVCCILALIPAFIWYLLSGYYLFPGQKTFLLI